MVIDNISVGILAGGKSSRMGTNKALLPWKNSTMIENLVDLFSDFSQKMISVGDISVFENTQIMNRENVCWVQDERKDYGPLEGVYQLLSNLENEWLFVVATDMPFVDEEFIQMMCDQIDAENVVVEKCQAIIPTENGKIHPLCGLYHKSVSDEIEKLICADEHRMKILLEKINVDYIELSTFTHDKNHSVVENVNTPEEYKKIC